MVPGGAVQLRPPLLVEPAGAEGVRHRGQEGHVVAPARLSAQADAVDTVVPVRHGGRRIPDVAPGRVVRHLHPRRVQKILAVHDHRAFAVERRRVQRAVVGQPAPHRRQDVGDVVAGAEFQRLEPAARAPDRGFVHADGHDVELAALRRDVGGHALPEDAFLQRHPAHRDARIGLLELGRQFLHLDHVAVVHGRDGQLAGCRGRRTSETNGQTERNTAERFHVFLLGNERSGSPNPA